MTTIWGPAFDAEIDYRRSTMIAAAAPRRARGRTDVWPLLAAAAPELAEWAAYFAAYAPAAQVGTVSERVAADMVRAAGQFLAEAARWLRRREPSLAPEP